MLWFRESERYKWGGDVCAAGASGAVWGFWQSQSLVWVWTGDGSVNWVNPLNTPVVHLLTFSNFMQLKAPEKVWIFCILIYQRSICNIAGKVNVQVNVNVPSRLWTPSPAAVTVFRTSEDKLVLTEWQRAIITERVIKSHRKGRLLTPLYPCDKLAAGQGGLNKPTATYTQIIHTWEGCCQAPTARYSQTDGERLWISSLCSDSPQTRKNKKQTNVAWRLVHY